MSPVNRSMAPFNGGPLNDRLVPTIDSNNYDLREAVKLPDGEDPNEWIAYHLFVFHQQVGMLYGTIMRFCTQEACPDMTAGVHKYLWSHGPERRPVDLTARQYIHHSLDWIDEQLDDDEIFPHTEDKNFPENFVTVAQAIAKRLFRVVAHVYQHHLQHVRLIKTEAHMNTSLKHFFFFIKEFELVTREDLEPLKDYVAKLC